MINISDITYAIAETLRANLDSTYSVNRNARRNMEYDKAVFGWVNVTKNSIDYEPYAIGGSLRATVRIDVEVQRAWMDADGNAEDKLIESEKDVLDILMSDYQMGGVVRMTNGYSITYDEMPQSNEGSRHESSIITVEAEVKDNPVQGLIDWTQTGTDLFKFSITITGADTFTLPLYSGGVYDFTISWGDGDSGRVMAYNDPDITHSYSTAGTYNIEVNGTLQGWSFNNSGDCGLMTDISQWGNFSFGNTAGMFYGCSNMTISATDSPTIGTNLNSCFRDCASITEISGISSWTVSAITDMAYLFNNCSSLGSIGDISGWDISAVTDMTDMFNGADDALTSENYDLLLIAWSALTVQSNVTAHFGDTIYTTLNGFNGKKTLIDTYNWTITDGNTDVIFWDSSEDLVLWDSSNDLIFWT